MEEPELEPENRWAQYVLQKVPGKWNDGKVETWLREHDWDKKEGTKVRKTSEG